LTHILELELDLTEPACGVGVRIAIEHEQRQQAADRASPVAPAHVESPLLQVACTQDARYESRQRQKYSALA
jgi:hypothetical protein